VLLVQSTESSPASSRESFYVAVSRGKQSVSVFTDDKRELKDVIQRSRLRLSATELVAKPKPQLWRRMRKAVTRIQHAAMLAAKQATYQVQETMQVKGKELAYER
jgi:predicted RNA-binding protein with PIN domain